MNKSIELLDKEISGSMEPPEKGAPGGNSFLHQLLKLGAQT